MLLKFFKQSLPQVIVVIIVLAIILWLQSFLSDLGLSYYFDSIKMPFYDFVTKWLNEGLLKSHIITFVIMMITAFLLLQINSKHIIIKQRTYLPAFIFIILVSGFLPLQRINPTVFASFFLVFAFDHILSLYHKENVLDNLYKAGFFIALATLFYAPVIFYLAAVFLSIISIRTFNIREWLVSIIGFLTPWFFFFFYHYYFNSDLTISYRILVYNLFTEINQNYTGTLFYIFCGYCIILFIITGLFLLNSLPNQKISVRKYHGVFFWFNLVTALIVLFVPSCSIEILYIAAIPVSFQFAHYFTLSNRKFWPSFFFILLIGIVALLQFY
ncbi:MAG: DUF6427 family protein [Tenuifilaceae bacterium]